MDATTNLIDIDHETVQELSPIAAARKILQEDATARVAEFDKRLKSLCEEFGVELSPVIQILPRLPIS